MSSIHEAIVKGRLEEICPFKNTDEMTLDDLVKDCNVAFQIIGYKPKNLEKSVRFVFENRDLTLLYEFVYEVWLNDN